MKVETENVTTARSRDDEVTTARSRDDEVTTEVVSDYPVRFGRRGFGVP